MNRLLILLPILIFTGCAQQSNKLEPANIKIPTSWHNQTNGEYRDTKEWWSLFNDTNLNDIVILAIKNNSSITRAGYRLKQASLTASLQNNTLFPQLSGSLSLNESRNFDSGDIGRGFGTSLKVGYEVDLWGKLSKASSAKEWETMATAQDMEATRLTIISQVVQTYWQQAYINEKIKVAKENLDKSKSISKLIEIRYKAGASSRLELLMANKTITTNEASLQKLLQEKEVASNAMALLLDIPPHSKFVYEPTKFPSKPLRNINANIPAIVLSNRPDVNAANLRVMKALDMIDVSKASFYPTFNLTGSLGTSSTALEHIISNPIGSIALGIALPFLNWNENSINLSISRIAYEDVKTDYKQKVLNALMEVENSLNANEKYAIEGKMLLKALKNASEQENLYAIRYNAGASSLKELLDAGDVTRNAKLAYIENLYRQYINCVDLHLAMGGV
jgi:NodT family efflux transporter outer membrane factor (OMF) lipoprotein